MVEGLRRLEYRGYDSTGLAVKNGTIEVHKKVGKVQELRSILPDTIEGNIGIAHTRWATHGGVTDQNAHPHSSANGGVVIVHNGIIENARMLRTSLSVQGVTLVSETDSEALAHIIERELNIDDDPEEAVRRALLQLRGTWGICVLFKDHDLIVCARNGSPLIIGQGVDEMFISSDPHALTAHTQQVIYLEDGDIATLTSTSVKLSTMMGGKSSTKSTVLESDWGESELGEYPHFMLKEIYEQPDALRHCISGRLDRSRGSGRLGGLKLSPAALAKIPHVRLLGCGTSYNAAEIGQLLIERLVDARLVFISSFAIRRNGYILPLF